MSAEDPTQTLISTGRCLCGRYRFRVQGAPTWVAYCHCESCRRFNGAPAAAYVGFMEANVRFEPNDPPPYASSAGVQRSFCELCGTPLTYTAEFFPGEVHLFRSNFDRPECYSPTRHVLFNEHESDHDIYDDLPRYGVDPGTIIAWGPRPAIRVLFLCTGNSARSILAEAILNLLEETIGRRRIRGHSAGSKPTGNVHPVVLELLKSRAHRLDHLRSKSWNEFTGPAAPSLDWIITLCDSAAAETCPTFPGAAEKRHWSLPDPASGAISFDDCWHDIEERIHTFLDELREQP